MRRIAVLCGGVGAARFVSGLVDVVDPIKTLILSGDERPVPVECESFFLRAALTPFQSTGQKTPDPAMVELRRVES